jgi:phytoene synthase
MLSPLAEMVRRHDPDRFFCALFAPADRRETLFTLLAFNHELARAQDATSEPGLALIRLHWWREVVDGAARRHEVASPLGAALGAGALPREALLHMIEARERESVGIDTIEDWCDAQTQGPGSLAVAAGLCLGADAQMLPRLRALGAGYGIAGRIRNASVSAGRGLDLLPRAAGEGVSLVLRLAELGRDMLGSAAPVPRAARAAALPAVFARRDLRRVPVVFGRRGVGDRLAVLAAALVLRA